MFSTLRLRRLGILFSPASPRAPFAARPPRGMSANRGHGFRLIARHHERPRARSRKRTPKRGVAKYCLQNRHGCVRHRARRHFFFYCPCCYHCRHVVGGSPLVICKAHTHTTHTGQAKTCTSVGVCGLGCNRFAAARREKIKGREEGG